MPRKTRRKLHPAEKADLAAARAAHVPSRTRLGQAVDWFAELGDQPPLIAASSGVLAVGIVRRDRRMIRTAARMLAAHAVATAIKTVIKDRVDRSRPATALGGRGYTLRKGNSKDSALRSMPSGHSAGLAAVAAAVAREYPATASPVAAAAGSVAAAQLPSDNHFLTDVAAGILIGLLSEKAVAVAMGPPTVVR